jgi:hypothetical protein
MDGDHYQHPNNGHFHYIILKMGAVYFLTDNALDDARPVHGMNDFIADLVHTAPPFQMVV